MEEYPFSSTLGKINKHKKLSRSLMNSTEVGIFQLVQKQEVIRASGDSISKEMNSNSTLNELIIMRENREMDIRNNYERRNYQPAEQSKIPVFPYIRKNSDITEESDRGLLGKPSELNTVWETRKR